MVNGDQIMIEKTTDNDSIEYFGNITDYLEYVYKVYWIITQNIIDAHRYFIEGAKSITLGLLKQSMDILNNFSAYMFMWKFIVLILLDEERIEYYPNDEEFRKNTWKWLHGLIGYKYTTLDELYQELLDDMDLYLRYSVPNRYNRIKEIFKRFNWIVERKGCLYLRLPK